MNETLHIVTLDQKPCVVHYLDRYNRFLVGTYELFTSIENARLKLNSQLEDQDLKKHLERINYRAGKLILLRGNESSTPCIEYEYDCDAGGGVFDVKLRPNKLDGSYNIFVAHANGTIAVYKLSMHCGTKICLKEHISNVQSRMLTTIDINPEAEKDKDVLSFNSNDGANHGSTNQCNINSSRCELSVAPASLYDKIIVGDSDGCVSFVTRGQVKSRLIVSQDESIWQVKMLRLSSGREIVFVGSESSSWRIYSLEEKSDELLLLYKNTHQDFSAGITCISVLEVIRSREYDMFEILLGSYDETLQTYHVKINHDGKSKPHVCHKNTLSIENGGIWRIKRSPSTKRKQIYVAAMYAGSYVLEIDSVDKEPREPDRLATLIDIETLKLAQKPLHYDIDVSSCNRTFCIADFNNSLCLLKTVEQL